MVDLVVIGAGLSGLMAAYVAAQAGMQVRVIAKGLGALHWAAGTIDVLGYLPGAPDQLVKRPLTAIQSLAQTHPDHPYTLLGDEQVALALAAFVALSKDIGVPYGGTELPGENLLLLSPAGAVRPTYLAPNNQLAGDLHRAEPMVIVGFRGLRDFYPELIAENLTKQGYPARAAFLPLSLITDRHDSNGVQLAVGLDNKERWPGLAAELKRIAQPGERIGLPAVLGMKKHLTLLADLERETGTAVFEIPTMPPSVPGVRLFTALRDYLRGMGVRVEAGMEVIGAKTTAANGAPGQVHWVESSTSARPLPHRAASYLLATGGILGSGFNSDINGRVWETIFDLPLTVPQKRSGWFQPDFLSPNSHPVFRGGIRVNQTFQPVDENGKLLYTNLWAVGSGLAAADPIQERSLDGIAVATGIAAAQAIRKYAI